MISTSFLLKTGRYFAGAKSVLTFSQNFLNIFKKPGILALRDLFKTNRGLV